MLILVSAVAFKWLSLKGTSAFSCVLCGSAFENEHLSSSLPVLRAEVPSVQMNYRTISVTALLSVFSISCVTLDALSV